MTQTLEEQLSALRSKTLTPIVRKAIANENAEVIDWSFSLLPWIAITPPTIGLYRFVGTARYRNKLIPWSMILKIAEWVDSGESEFETKYNSESSGLNYWKREDLVYQSGILEDFRGGIVPVKCFAVLEPTDNTAWMWLEEVHEPNRSNWSMERHVLAAQHFGLFNGAYASYSPSVNDNQWLSRQFIRQWMQAMAKLGIGEITHDSDFWKHPYARVAFHQDTSQRLQSLITDTDYLCDLLEKQPQTLSHQDTHWSNLFATHDTHGREQTTVIDWSYLGLAAIGEDLGTQISGNLLHLFVDPAQAKVYYQAAIDAYIDGLHQSGWHGDSNSVRFACAATAVQRHATFGVMMLKWFTEDEEKTEPSWIDDFAQKEKLTVEEALQGWGTAISFLFDLADEARYLASRL